MLLLAKCLLVGLVGKCVLAELQDCPGSPTEVWRNENQPMECEEKEVCGDKWTTIRDWRNGTRCHATSVIHNCLCPANNNGHCPVEDENYALHASRKHKQYLCQPACDLQKCRRMRPAMEKVEHYRDRNRRNYYRINCRCPAHDQVSSLARRRVTSFRRLFWDRSAGIIYQQFVCSQGQSNGQGDERCNTD